MKTMMKHMKLQLRAQHEYTLSDEDPQAPKSAGCSREANRLGRRKRRTQNKEGEKRMKHREKQLNIE